MHRTCPLLTQSRHRECSAKLADFYSIYSVDDLKDVRGLTLAVSQTPRAEYRSKPSDFRWTKVQLGDTNGPRDFVPPALSLLQGSRTGRLRPKLWQTSAVVAL
jgi:hypothetical protein